MICANVETPAAAAGRAVIISCKRFIPRPSKDYYISLGFLDFCLDEIVMIELNLR